jgi:hypothetical protein
MIIMQTLSATPRREYLEANNLAKVIFVHKLEESVCIQYHPKGIKGWCTLSLQYMNADKLRIQEV